MKPKLLPCSKCGAPGKEVDPVWFGREKREKREFIGLSLRRVAVRMGISMGYLCDLELGRRHWTEDMVRRFEAALREEK